MTGSAAFVSGVPGSTLATPHRQRAARKAASLNARHFWTLLRLCATPRVLQRASRKIDHRRKRRTVAALLMRARQAARMISGPMPAGSPMLTAMGFMAAT